ncbi:MAG: hypothetical protein N2558_03710 [Patescibacteria group bacterium]|nr:hypothetical protein [Patescibacteria group bacterium]
MNNLAIDLGRTFFGGNTPHPTEQVTGLGSMVSVFVSNSIILAGLIFMFMTIYAGFQIIMAAGDSNERGMEKAKQTLTTSFIGFCLVFGAFFIIRIVEQVTGIIIL